MSPADPARFVAANTRPGSHPLVPEITLRLAREIVPIWHATEESLKEEVVEPPFWAFAWPGGAALARWALDHPAAVRGRPALDLAAGSGIAAIALALSEASPVRAADVDPLARAAIALNAADNGVGIEVPGGDPLSLPAPDAGLVVAGDVCYERDLAARMTAWLRAAARRGCEVLVADPGRAYLPAEGLEEVARYAVPTSLELEDRATRETVIYRLSGA